MFQDRSSAGLMLAAAVCVAATLGSAEAQIPNKFTNLEVLPPDISKPELVELMRGFATSLAVRCSHCHEGPDNLQGMDFATDKKATKRTARVMMRMVREINGRLLKDIETDRSTRVEVVCQTCHHRVTVPRPIEDIVSEAIAEKGVQSGLAHYRELRDKFYGRAAYDFSDVPLNSLAERLVDHGRLEEALAVQLANIELHPDVTYPRVLLGSIHKARGEKQEALAAYRKALELDPSSAWVKKLVDDLSQELAPAEDKGTPETGPPGRL